MKTTSLLRSCCIALALCVAAALPAQAEIRIYKVTFVAKAVLFPTVKTANNTNAHSFTDSGYVVYDTANPANSETVQVFPLNKTYSVNGNMLQDIFPSQIALQLSDRNGNGVNDTEFALIAFANGNIVHSRSLIGTVVPTFTLNGRVFNFTARALHGVGSLTNPTFDHFTVTETWTLDPLSGANPANANAGVILITAPLASKGYQQVP